MEVVREFDSVSSPADYNRRGAQLFEPVEFGDNAKVATGGSYRIDGDARESIERFISSQRVRIESGRNDKVADRAHGKSIMGIFSLNLSKPIKIEIHSDDCDEFVSQIERFIVE